MPPTKRWQSGSGRGLDIQIATQNIDDLRQRAGSRRVYPIHGTYRTSTCQIGVAWLFVRSLLNT
jgi:NAD-dependent SIR2 family protein deacetylase